MPHTSYGARDMVEQLALATAYRHAGTLYVLSNYLSIHRKFPHAICHRVGGSPSKG